MDPDQGSESPVPMSLKSDVGVYTYDVATGTTRGCGQLAKYFGMPREQCIAGLPLDAFLAAIHPDDRIRVENSIKRTISDGGLFVERYRTVRPTEPEFPLRAIGYCFRDASGRPASFVGAVEPEQSPSEPSTQAAIQHALAAYSAAADAHRPFAQYLIALVLQNLGVASPDLDPKREP